MSTLESRTWDAEQDRISDDRYARKVAEALASPAAVVDSLLASLEGGPLTVAVTGTGVGFEHDDLPVELVFNSAERGAITGTLWVDDEHENPVEITDVRLTVEVLS